MGPSWEGEGRSGKLIHHRLPRIRSDEMGMATGRRCIRKPAASYHMCIQCAVVSCQPAFPCLISSLRREKTESWAGNCLQVSKSLITQASFPLVTLQPHFIPGATEWTDPSTDRVSMRRGRFDSQQRGFPPPPPSHSFVICCVLLLLNFKNFYSIRNISKILI